MGVARALADYSMIDVWIVRVLLVLFTLFGGSGLILYIACALLIPSQSNIGGPNYTTIDRLKKDRAPGTIIGLVVLAVGALVLIGTVGDNDFILPITLIAGGAALILWNNEQKTQLAGAPPQAGAPAAESTMAPPPPPAGMNLAAPAAPPAEPTADVFEPAPAPSQPYGTPGVAYQEPAPTWTPPQPVKHEPPLPPKPKTRSKLTWLTLAGLAVYFGTAIVLDQSTSLNADFDRTVAWGLAALGVVLTASAFIGRARGLIFFGLLMLPIMFISGADWDVDFDGGSIETKVVQVGSLDDDYDTGIGSVNYDFSELDLGGETRTINIDHDIGEVEITVPDDVELIIDAEADIGDVTVLGRNDDGPGATVNYTTGTENQDNGTLILDINLGLGEIKVTQ